VCAWYCFATSLFASITPQESHHKVAVRFYELEEDRVLICAARLNAKLNKRRQVKMVTPTEWNNMEVSQDGLYQVENLINSMTMLVTTNQAVDRSRILRCGSTYW
jgi:hypothetical protein